MLKIYTPGEWFKVFGGYPTLIVDDDGKIFSEKDYYNLMVRNPIGMVDFEKGEIYGSDWANYVVRTPVGYMKQQGDVTEIYNRLPGFTALPLLYVREGKVYSYDEYHRFLGGNPSAYVQEEKPQPRKKAGIGGGAGGLGELGIFLAIVAALLAGKVAENFWSSFKMLSVMYVFFIVSVLTAADKCTKLTLAQLRPESETLAKAKKKAHLYTAIAMLLPLVSAVCTAISLAKIGPASVLFPAFLLAGMYFLVYRCLRNRMLTGKMKI